MVLEEDKLVAAADRVVGFTMASDIGLALGFPFLRPSTCLLLDLLDADGEDAALRRGA
tara:strand:- start:139 stop:312 length:174 start_codon:yes stop_codon:yes gene_type:complete